MMVKVSSGSTAVARRSSSPGWAAFQALPEARSSASAVAAGLSLPFAATAEPASMATTVSPGRDLVASLRACTSSSAKTALAPLSVKMKAHWSAVLDG